jgi:hypothetical protein
LAKDEFVFSALRGTLLGPAAQFIVSHLMQAEDALQQLASGLIFRHNLADGFDTQLKKNAGKAQTLSFALQASPMSVGTLFGWPGLPAPVFQAKGAGHNRISPVFTDKVVRSPALPKELVVMKLDSPVPLVGLLGK